MIAYQRLGPLQPVHRHNLALSDHILRRTHQLARWHTCVPFTFTLTCTGSHDTMTTSYIYHQTIIHTTHSTYCPSRLCQWPCSCRRRRAVSCRPCPPNCTRAGIECVGAGRGTGQAVALTHGLYKIISYSSYL